MDKLTHKGLRGLSAREFGIGVLFDSVADAVVVGNADTEEIVLWNRAAQRIFGYSPDEIIGRPIHTLIPERLHDDHRSGLKRYSETGTGSFIGTEMSLDLPAIRKDGSEIEVAVTLTPVEAEGLAGRFALAIIRDVTYRREFEEDLRKASARLEDLDQLRNDFVAMIAHDLRSRLTVISGMLSTIERSGRMLGEKRVAELFKRCLVAADQATRLVDDIMTVADIEREGLEVNPCPIDLAEVVYLAVASARAATPDVRFEVRVEDDAPATLADERRIGQVLTNLLSNAVKFSPENSTVRVELANAGTENVVTVTDEGRGISLQDQQRIFDKYERVRSTDAREVKGTGLGLFICRSLVEAHGGRVWVDSQPAQGSKFGFSLPVVDRRGRGVPDGAPP